MPKSKLGKNFELVVQDIVKEMDPHAIVTQGEWVDGPDGSREIDVLIEGTVASQRRRVQVECKDYNPGTRSIGIGTIDALESKHRDLGVDISLLCSNAGFSAEAVSKEKRVGIGLIGALREEDQRVRYKVADEIYIRRVEIVDNSGDFSIHFQGPGLPAQTPDEYLYDGKPVMEWLLHRMTIFLASNLVVAGRHRLIFRFLIPVEISTSKGTAACAGAEFGFEIKGQWIAQVVEIDAKSGLYDWIHQTVALAPGPNKIVYKDLKFGTGGTPIKCPPGFDPSKLKKVPPGQVDLVILDLGGFRGVGDYPDLDKAVVPGDLEFVRGDIAEDAYLSTGL